MNRSPTPSDSDIPDSPHCGTAHDLAPQMEAHGIQWLGSGNQYFRIWIVNLALTLGTLGIYLPWARIRTRRYFYTHTELAGHGFEYLARPLPMLFGYAIVLLGLVLYNAVQFIQPALVVVILLLFFAIWPWLYWKALRFRFHNSSYRGIRFPFTGTLKESYTINFFWSLLIPLTGGLIYPLVEFKRKAYVFNHLQGGRTRFVFKGEMAPFFVIYAIAYGVVILVNLILFAALIVVLIGAGVWTVVSGSGTEPSGPLALMAFMGFAMGYAFLLLTLFGVQVYLSTRVLNYCLNHLQMENGLRFVADIRFAKMLKIRLTNLIRILFTLGLYIPWAAVRRHSYLISCIQVQYPQGSMQRMTGDPAAENSAIGDASVDFLDFDIGF